MMIIGSKSLRYIHILLFFTLLAVGCFSGGVEKSEDSDPTSVDFTLTPGNGFVDIRWDVKLFHNYSFVRSEKEDCDPENLTTCLNPKTKVIKDGSYKDNDSIINLKTYYYWIFVSVAGTVGKNGPQSVIPTAGADAGNGQIQ